MKLVDVLYQVLTEAGVPLQINVMTPRVQLLRSTASAVSIGQTLKRHPEKFRKVSRGVFTLIADDLNSGRFESLYPIRTPGAYDSSVPVRTPVELDPEIVEVPPTPKPNGHKPSIVGVNSMKLYALSNQLIEINTRVVDLKRLSGLDLEELTVCHADLVRFKRLCQSAADGLSHFEAILDAAASAHEH